jgi:hypothetical protein
MANCRRDAEKLCSWRLCNRHLPLYVCLKNEQIAKTTKICPRHLACFNSFCLNGALLSKFLAEVAKMGDL